MGKVVSCKMNIKIFNTPKQVSNELSSYIISKYILRRKKPREARGIFKSVYAAIQGENTKNGDFWTPN